MGITAIDHWVIVAGDLQRTLNFYQRLGFTIAWETRPGRPDMATIRINPAQKINVMGPRRPGGPAISEHRGPPAGGPASCLKGGGPVGEVSARLREIGIVPQPG